MVLLIDSRERRTGWGKGVVDEKEESLLRSHRHTLSDQEAQLTHCEVRGHEVLLLVQVRSSRPGSPLHNDRYLVGMLGSHPLTLCPPHLQWYRALVLTVHLLWKNVIKTNTIENSTPIFPTDSSRNQRYHIMSTTDSSFG